MDINKRKEAVKKAENRTPLNLLYDIAICEVDKVFESVEYIALFTLLRDRFKIIYTIKELNEQKKREEAKKERQKRKNNV